MCFRTSSIFRNMVQLWEPNLPFHMLKLALSYWEERYVWTHNPYDIYIVFPGRYIDDILIIWNGSIELFESFFTHCNDNNLGLGFTHVLDPTNLVFLDLVLYHEGGSICTKNYCKPTSGNSYLHYTSFLHPSWIKNILSGQFQRLRRNCSNRGEYELQSVSLKNTFLQKGYPAELVQTAHDKFLEKLPAPKIHEISDADTIRFVTMYNSKYRSIQSIVKKH